MNLFENALSSLNTLELILIVGNLFLLLFSRTIILRLTPENKENKGFSARLHIFRSVNVLILVALVLTNIFLPAKQDFWLTKLISVFIIIYLGYLSFHILNYFIRKKFGREKILNDQTVLSDTYNTRVLGLLLAISVSIITLIGIIQTLEFDSLLEAGGMLGIIGVFLALTQSSWAPDIISGLIILNSNLVEEGDVIEIDNNRTIIGMVFKTRIFHTEILNLANNHRVMIRNAKLRDYQIYNFSKFASARGLRDSLSFKVGYDVSESALLAMFEKAFEAAEAESSIALEYQHPFELRAMNSGDFAVEWAVFFYSKAPEKILANRQLLTSIILKTAQQENISLATPVLHTSSHLLKNENVI